MCDSAGGQGYAGFPFRHSAARMERDCYPVCFGRVRTIIHGCSAARMGRDCHLACSDCAHSSEHRQHCTHRDRCPACQHQKLIESSLRCKPVRQPLLQRLIQLINIVNLPRIRLDFLCVAVRIAFGNFPVYRKPVQKRKRIKQPAGNQHIPRQIRKCNQKSQRNIACNLQPFFLPKQQHRRIQNQKQNYRCGQLHRRRIHQIQTQQRVRHGLLFPDGTVPFLLPQFHPGHYYPE